MGPNLDIDTVQRQDDASQSPVVISSFPVFPAASYNRAGPWIYSGNLVPNTTTTTTIITAQMDPQLNGSWTNAASIGVEHPGLPVPQQASFAEYWRHISGSQQPNSRRPSSSTVASALSSGSGTNSGTIGPNTSLPTSSSYPMSPGSIPPHHPPATRYLVPHLNTTAGLEQGHGVPSFLSPPHHMNFSPSAETGPPGNGDSVWHNGNINEHSLVEHTRGTMVLSRSQHATSSGASISLGSGSVPLWHTVPRLGPPLPPFPRWNHHQLPSSTWIPQMSPDPAPAPAHDSGVPGGVPPQPHTQPYMRRPASSIMPPPSIQQNISHLSHQHPHPHHHHHHHHHQGPQSQSHQPPPTSSEIPQVGRPDTAAGVGAGYAYPARVVADTNPPPPPHDRGSTVAPVSRPAVSVRRRSSLSASVSGTNFVKRKPLPKIYGCDGCGKKFDRPSTLKVHEAIHTGAKDHLCEYCIRAFTVQSNMKRHMRVCKHKPLSPPMSLCYIISTASSLTTSRSRTPFQAMQQIDRSSSLMLHGDGGPGSSSSTSTHPSILSASIRQTPMIETPSGSVPMISFEHSQYMDQSQVSHPHAESPPMVKGYKAPMIIAAMFSVQQNVPASVAKFTLVHLECEIPLPPITPHPEYVGLYPDANGFTAKIIEQPEPEGEPFSYPELPQARYSQSSFASSSTSLPSTLHSVETVSTAAPTEIPHSEDHEDTLPLEYFVDLGMRTKGTSPLPDIRFEERNSFYPRSRYPYHPAEWDPIKLLPGPGIVDLPEEIAEFAANP